MMTVKLTIKNREGVSEVIKVLSIPSVPPIEPPEFFELRCSSECQLETGSVVRVDEPGPLYHRRATLVARKGSHRALDTLLFKLLPV